jgi:IS30 family transposase
MMTQEEYMKVQELRAAGWTIVQIAEHVGYHPATVSEWLRNGGPPARRATRATSWSSTSVGVFGSASCWNVTRCCRAAR